VLAGRVTAGLREVEDGCACPRHCHVNRVATPKVCHNGRFARVASAFPHFREATDSWASGIFTTTITGLAFAALYAVSRRGPRRAFGAAFAAFGWGYSVLTFCPGGETTIRPRLVTTRLFDALFLIVHPAPEPTVGLWDASTGKPVPAGKPIDLVTFAPDGRMLD
jgi:hypothetical protein